MSQYQWGGRHVVLLDNIVLSVLIPSYLSISRICTPLLSSSVNVLVDDEKYIVSLKDFEVKTTRTEDQQDCSGIELQFFAWQGWNCVKGSVWCVMSEREIKASIALQYTWTRLLTTLWPKDDVLRNSMNVCRVTDLHLYFGLVSKFPQEPWKDIGMFWILKGSFQKEKRFFWKSKQKVYKSLPKGEIYSTTLYWYTFE